MRARFRDMFNNAPALHRLALSQLDLERGVAPGGHRNLFHHLPSSFNIVRTDPRLAQTPKQNTLMNWRVPSHERFIADRFAGKNAAPTIRFRKNNSAACGPQDPRPDRRGSPARPPRHLKEWCNMALYARGQLAAKSDYPPAPAALRWC